MRSPACTFYIKRLFLQNNTIEHLTTLVQLSENYALSLGRVNMVNYSCQRKSIVFRFYKYHKAFSVLFHKQFFLKHARILSIISLVPQFQYKRYSNYRETLNKLNMFLYVYISTMICLIATWVSFVSHPILPAWFCFFSIQFSDVNSTFISDTSSGFIQSAIFSYLQYICAI